jgi:RNA polymerase sigma factor (sigma-70 family)
MADPLAEFRDLLGRARRGDPDASARLFERYGQTIIKAVRRRLHHRMRTQFDSLDFAQDVWTSFFTGDACRFEFDTPAALAAFLEEVARNKVIDATRARCEIQKRDLRRERSLAEEATVAQAEAARRGPTPSQYVMAEEEWERLLERAPEHHRRILVLLRQGHTHDEIARKLNTTTKTIQRLLRHICPGLTP